MFSSRFGVSLALPLTAAVMALAFPPGTSRAAQATPPVRAVIVGREATGVEQTAAEYLARVFARHSGTTVPVQRAETFPDRSVLIALGGSARRLVETDPSAQPDSLGDEGFSIVQLNDEGRRSIAVVGNGERGALYGAFELARRVDLGADPWSVTVRERPAFPFRCLWSWSRPTARRGAFFNYEDMMRAEQCERYRRFGELLASMRVNAFCFWGRYGEDGDASGETLATIRAAYRNFTTFLKKRYGVDSYVFAVYGMGGDLSQLCVHDPRVRSRWRKRVETLFGQYPNLKGIILAGAGGDWVRGPWECRCEKCRRRTNRELLLAAMEMIGGPMRPYGGRLIWKAVTDRPTLVHTEVKHFGRLAGLAPDNVWIAFKTFYKDFRPPHPYNALFYQLAVDPPKPAPYVTEFQILGEYRGLDHFPCSMAERWAPIFRMVEARRERGVIGVVSAEPGRHIDHPLNGINWYAFGRWSWNPREPVERVMNDWARLEFGEKAAPAVVEILRDSYRASTRMMFMQGVMTQNHSRLPSINYELESSLVGPWHDIARAREGYIGRAHDLSMYPPAVAEAIRSDPALRLFAHRVALTPALADEGIREKQEAVEIVRRMIGAWERARGLVSDATFATIAAGLRKNRVDAELWKEDVALYLDYKAGRLTRDDLAARLQRIRARFPRGGSPISSGEVFDRFLEEWQAVLDGTFKRRVMEGVHFTAPVDFFPPGFAARK